MCKISIVLTLLFISYHIKAQTQYGSGYYYDTSNKKISGLIKFPGNNDYIYFKTDKDAKSEKIKIKDLNSVILLYGGMRGIDSLCVLTQDNNEKRKYFADFYFASPINRFYYKDISGSYGGMPTLTTFSNVPNSTNNGVHSINRLSTSSPTYFYKRVIMYSEDNTTYELTKSNYIEVLSKSFADVPELAQKIQNKEFKFKQVREIIVLYRTKTTFKGQ